MRRPWTFWVFCGFAVVGAYYLIAQHRAHVLDYLPYVLLIACPFMHLLHGHGGRRHEAQEHAEVNRRAAS
jgi:DUF2933 family protein